VKESVFVVRGMTCASCSGAIEKHFKTAVEGALSINISLLTNKAVIKHDTTKLRARMIISEIEDLGFEAELQPSNETVDIREIVKEEVKKYLNRLKLALLLYIPISFLIWVVPYTGMKSFMTSLLIWRGNSLYVFLNMILAGVIQFYMGHHFYQSAYKSLKHKSANMDVLIVLSTTAAYFYGVVLTIIGYSEHDQMSDMFHMQVHSHVHNWETSSVLIMIIILGKYIESYSKMKTVDKLSNLASLKVSKANLVHEKDQNKLNLGCKFTEIPVELLEKKDFVLVQPGGAVPSDGKVVYGRGLCNESMLTGEARPVNKEIGLKVFGGTILIQGSIIVKVEKTSEDATFNQIMRLVENAQNTKAPIQGFADKISSVFVPIIVVLAIIDWIVWYSIVYSDSDDKLGILGSKHMSRFEFAFDFGISTLVIACPCALGLATPTAVMVGTGLAASYGILIKSADVLEKIYSINTIVFDKTGTLTSGKP
jgi:P-type Cu+ transporter